MSRLLTSMYGFSARVTLVSIIYSQSIMLYLNIHNLPFSDCNIGLHMRSA